MENRYLPILHKKIPLRDLCVSAVNLNLEGVWRCIRRRSGMALRACFPSRLNISWGAVVGIAGGAFVIYLLIVPVGMLLFSSFRATNDLLPFEATRFTLSNYVTVFTSGLTYQLLWNTLRYSFVALVIGLGLALPIAWFVERSNAPGRRILVSLVLTPIGVPGVVLAMAWSLIANPTNGILNLGLREVFNMTHAEGPINIYSIAGMGFVTGLQLVPSAYILVASVMARLDPALEEASLASGASQWTTFRYITGVLMRPALLAVVIYYGVLTIEMFETPALLGMPKRLFVFSTLIYHVTHPNAGLPDYGLASGYAMLVLMMAGGLIYLYHTQVRRQERFAVVTGKGYRPRLVVLRTRWQVVFISVIAMYLLCSVLVPFMVLMWASLGILYTPKSLELVTLKYYGMILNYPGILRAIWNTFIISVGSATLTMVLSLLTSWLAVRGNFRTSSLPDRLTIVAVAMPNIIIALSLIFFYARFPIPIYGTIWIIMIAHVTRFMAYGARLMHTSYLQLHRELEEASEASGASWFATITWIVFPILRSAFVRGWLWTFVHALRDVTLALMLFSVYNNTIGVNLWIIWMDNAFFQLGAAIAVPLMLVSLGFSFLIVRPATVK